MIRALIKGSGSLESSFQTRELQIFFIDVRLRTI